MNAHKPHYKKTHERVLLYKDSLVLPESISKGTYSLSIYINLTCKYEIEDLETNYRNKNEKAPFSEIESPITPSEYVKNFERSLKNVINLKSNYESI